MLVVASGAGVLGVACASNEAAGDGPAPGDPGRVPTPDAGGDAALDARDDAPCADCADFPSVCSDDVLCPNGPFGSPDDPSSLDPRTDVLVVRGRGPNDVWVAGAIGAVAHFDGTSWARSDLGAPETQRALWLRDSGEVAFGTFSNLYTRGPEFDAGDAGISPGGWSLQPPPPAPSSFDPSSQSLRFTWAWPGSNTLWMGTLGTCGLWRLRFTPPSTLEILEGIAPSVCADIGGREVLGIHGVSAASLWAVGGGGAAIHVTGADGDAPVAKPFNSLTPYALRGVWAASENDVWAVGASGTIRHYRGDSLFWEVVDDVPTTRALNAVWGTSAADVWAVGDAGTVLHYDGSHWSRMKVAGLGALRPNLYAVWSPSPGHVWIGGQGVVLSVGGKP
ncbi:hypothetical protein AKJ09_05440 [Labilithrix luteola]|uniref:Type IV fimbrial biogenesis protein PilY1 n=1 Tax=Labilithrix luteola TaxID=1391654 RepID=A0A0K1PZH4_9BACT|nr:hypothetical protein AKJ09_05440 [Labilithrix luteola]